MDATGHATQLPAPQEEKPVAQQPYPWGSVFSWALVAFLLGLVTARPAWKSATSIDRTASGVFSGIVYAVLTAAIVGAYKYFHRNPSSLFGGNTWKRVPAEEAKKHPLYGVGGWLAWFAFIFLLGISRTAVEINAEALKAGMSMGAVLAIDSPVMRFMKILLAIEVLAGVVFYWLLFSKHRSFRLVSSCILLGRYPVVSFVAIWGATSSVPELVPGLGAALVIDFIAWVTSCAIWVTYLQRSKRVRVTFEHCVKVEQDPVVGISHAPFAPKASEPRAGTSTDDATHKHLGQDLAAQTSRQTPESVWDKQFSGTFQKASVQVPSPEIIKPMSSTQPTVKPSVATSVSTESRQHPPEALEDQLYQQIGQELETNAVDKGLWTKAYAQAGGDDQQTRVLYIKARFARLLMKEDA